jgi:predicted neuraminidase
MGHENHAANLGLLPDGDLLCAWFAGSAEGTGDMRFSEKWIRSGLDTLGGAPRP